MKKQFQIDESGEVDYHKFDVTSPIFKYICSKMPDVFLRGCGIFKPFYDFYYQDSEKMNLSYDEIFFSRMHDNGFADVFEFEKMYPTIKLFAETLSEKIMTVYNKEVMKKLWDNGNILPDKMKNLVEKYRDVYTKIINNNGHFKHLDWQRIEYLLENEEIENNEEMNFIYKTCKYYEKLTITGWNVDENEEKTKYEIAKKSKENYAKKINELRKQLDEIDKELNNFNFITMLIPSARRRKSNLKAQKKNVLDELEYIEQRNAKNRRLMEEYEDRNEIRSKYIDEYNRVTMDEIIPKIKAEFANNPNKELIDKMISYYFSDDKLKKANGTILIDVNKLLLQFANTSFDEYITPFKNSLKNLEGLPNVLLQFEESEQKDLYSFLNIARKELSKAKIDKEHGKLDDGYRKENLSAGNEFFTFVSDYRDIPNHMEKLNNDFKELMAEENLEEYVRKAGVLWYQFILIHPYLDGNGRTGRYLLNTLLAHRNIIIPALYNSRVEQKDFVRELDNLGIWEQNLKAVGDIILDKVAKKSIDLSGTDRLSISNKKVIKEYENNYTR